MDAFNTLRSINVGEHIEKKNGMSYLSWAWAWDKFKMMYPESYYTIYENKDGCFYFTDGRTCWVKTGVTLVDGEKSLEHIEYLPIMDVRNKSIALNSVTSFDVNKAIQRSLTKAVARHGLGLYIYAGEDLPEESDGTEPENHSTAKTEFSNDKVKKTNVVQFNVGVAMTEMRTRLNISKDDLVRYRATLIAGGAIVEKPSASMTQEDVDMLENAIRQTFLGAA